MRALRVLLLAAFVAAVPFVTGVRGDIGRNGGIVVLPSAVPYPDAGQTLRFEERFGPGLGLVAQLPPNLNHAAFAVQFEEGQPVSLGRLQGDQFVITPDELEHIAGTGSGSLSIRFVGADSMALHLELLVRSDTGYDLEVW